MRFSRAATVALAAGIVSLIVSLALMVADADDPISVSEPPATTTSKQTQPSETPTPSPTAPAPAGGSAAAEVLELAVKGRAPKTGYARDQFGPAWVDVDRNGCDTRNDLLGAHLTNRDMSGSCKVLAGDLADQYTGEIIRFTRGGASEVDIDHVVALSDAWQKGASRWPYAKRVAFANDPLNLVPSDASSNRQKGDSDAASWLPSNTGFRCAYVARQAAVKKKYELWVTQAERDAMLRVLRACPDTALPAPGDQSTLASNLGGSAPAPTPTPTTAAPTSDQGRSTDPQFRTCALANDAGYGPYDQGEDPEYSWYQDRDHDGSVCE